MPDGANAEKAYARLTEVRRAQDNTVASLAAAPIYYRVRIGGFADSRKAGDFCAAFRGSGRDCFLVPKP